MYHSKEIGRRPIVMTSSDTRNKNISAITKHKPLRIYIGDMVRITDPRSALFNKFGLVETICPQNKEWQVMVKIGPESHKMFFKQLRFCTRINKNKIKSVRNDKTESSVPKELYKNDETWSPGVSREEDVPKISDFIDQTNNDEDNKYNR